eukprot:CAMPEP_0184644404 /NCGR_PEP_ID=MMETSP0308-20130426/1129_1 /TAXON_ID=38269 /ORGANISM="Gloeochaete witrockiana, Strain SAG 46.84" /LENGTH=304 /DNA_ID=CAMNT_0027072925 /DNA_START=76 /DNA_END=990 /DNA_ORIENTATION=+
MEHAEIGVMGGSGLYSMDGLKDVVQVEIDTPFGRPSDAFTIGNIHGVRIAFLPRHGKGHRYLPSEVPTRANIYAFKKLGVKWLISVSACGSLREDYRPGDIVVPSGVFDHTNGRSSTFFSEGCVAHVSVAEPFCPVLSQALYGAVQAAFKSGATGVPGSRVHRGGNLIVINGPRFSTKTESLLYRQWGMDLVNMTTAPEAFLAKEAEIAYAVMNHVTDYDCWHETEEAVTVEKVIQILLTNVKLAQAAISDLVHALNVPNGPTLTSPSWSALKDALLTRSVACPVDTRRRLAFLLDKYWGKAVY